jgi:hypothetical protein
VLDQPSHYLKKHVRFVLHKWDGPSDPEDRAKIFDMWNGAELAMYGSNYPHWDYLPPQDAILALPEAVRDAVMGGNAARLYRLGEDAEPARSAEPVAG